MADEQEEERGAFDKVFNISASRNPGVLLTSVLDVTTKVDAGSAALVTTMKDDLDRRHIDLDLAAGPLNKDGSFSIIFQAASIPGAVVRLGQLDNPPESDIVLRPLARLVYKGTSDISPLLAPEYQVHILPFAPDRGKVSTLDIVNTIRVLKAEGNIEKLVDVSDTQFVFLQDEKGNTLRYPDNLPDETLRGRPIAFIRDINAIQDDARTASQLSGTGNAGLFLEELAKLFRLGRWQEPQAEKGTLVTRIDTQGMAEDDLAGLLRKLEGAGFKPEQQGTALSLKGADIAALYALRDSLTPETLPAAPKEAVTAAAGQDLLTEKLRQSLQSGDVNLEGAERLGPVKKPSPGAP
jgi:hypothetical protein